MYINVYVYAYMYTYIYIYIYMADCRWVRRKNDVENGGNIGG